MTTSFRQESQGSQTQMLSTELNSLASAAGAIQNTGTNAAFDNSSASNLWFLTDFELDVTFGSAPNGTTGVDLYILYDMGNGYTDGSATVFPVENFVGTFPCRAVNTAQKIPLYSIPVRPYPLKVIAVNNTNQAFPASGTTVKMNPSRQQAV